jgi:hypothetical protein
MTTATSAHVARLTKREEIAGGAVAFHIAKPADFQFSQAIDVTFLNLPETDAERNARIFLHECSVRFGPSAIKNVQELFHGQSCRGCPAVGCDVSHPSRDACDLFSPPPSFGISKES